MARESVVVAGGVAREPGRAGHAWAFLQYLLGFRRLGYDVLFVDTLETADGAAVAWLDSLLGPRGIPYALLDGATGSLAGLDRRETLERLRSSRLLLNVNGYLRDAELLDAARLRVFLDIDPGFVQMWKDLGLADVLSGHDAYATVGENVGRPGCAVPTAGVDWIGTAPPVVLEEWPAVPSSSRTFTTVGRWRGPLGPIEHGGRTYGLRVHAFRGLAELPARTGARFEVALDLDPADEADRLLLESRGWVLLDPLEVAGTLEGYRAFLAGSGAELLVPKQIHVAARTGWFSDRSACYLACGRPVVGLDTGFGDTYPVGDGLLAVSTLEEAAAAVASILSDFDRHSRAARALAEERLDSDRVLARLLEAVLPA